MRSKNIFEALLYSIAFMRYGGFYGLLQTTIFAPNSDTSTRKVSLYILGHIYAFLKSLFYSESNGVIFNFLGQRNHKL